MCINLHVQFVIKVSKIIKNQQSNFKNCGMLIEMN